MTDDEAEKRLDAAINTLREFFDAVQIFGTWHEEGTTNLCGRGFGNYYARRDICRSYVQSEEQKDQARKIADAFDARPPEEGDERRASDEQIASKIALVVLARRVVRHEHQPRNRAFSAI